MFILDILPSWFIYVVYFCIFVGILFYFISYFLGHMPLFQKHAIIFRLLAMTLIVSGVYVTGANSNQEFWKEKLRDADANIERLEAKIKDSNQIIVENEVVKPTTEIKEKIKVVTAKIPVYITDKCDIPKEAVIIHNDAARLNHEKR